MEFRPPRGTNRMLDDRHPGAKSIHKLPTLTYPGAGYKAGDAG